MKRLLYAVLLLSTTAWALEVTTSILPQKYFIEKIAGDKVNVNVMVQKGFSPATYEPKTSQMKKLSNSTLYFSIGVPFERVWLKRFNAANDSMHIIDTSRHIKKQSIQAHTHAEDHEHHETKHERLDPHIWLDPTLVKIQAKNIYEALAKHDAQHRAFYQKNYEQFIEELRQLHGELKTILKPVKNRAFLVFHPSWGYFAHQYDLEQIAVEVEGKEPKPNQLIELIHTAKARGIKVIFVAPQFSKKSAQVIGKNIDATLFTIDHLREDWQQALIDTAKAVVKSYKQ